MERSWRGSGSGSGSVNSLNTYLQHNTHRPLAQFGCESGCSIKIPRTSVVHFNGVWYGLSPLLGTIHCCTFSGMDFMETEGITKDAARPGYLGSIGASAPGPIRDFGPQRACQGFLVSRLSNHYGSLLGLFGHAGGNRRDLGHLLGYARGLTSPS